MSTALTVSRGPYFGFTLAELKTELTRYKAAVQASGSDLAGASVNGQSFTFGPRRDWSLGQWQRELANALNELDPDNYAAPSRQIVARFRAD